jgi:hypothetical protein
MNSRQIMGQLAKVGTYRRIGLWLCAFLISVILFSLLCCLASLFRSFSVVFQFTAMLQSFLVVLKVTTILALPVWLLCLPFVVLFKDAEQRRPWIMVMSGTLIGPACLIILGLILQLAGRDAHMIWQGDGIDLGIVPSIPFALGLGFLSASLYVIGLRVISRRSTATPAS